MEDVSVLILKNLRTVFPKSVSSEFTHYNIQKPDFENQLSYRLHARELSDFQIRSKFFLRILFKSIIGGTNTFQGSEDLSPIILAF